MIISYLIPVYNTEVTLLQNCLNSIYNQTVKISYEIIIVNDGSTNLTTNSFLESLMSESTVSVIYQENKGLAAARNTGIFSAKGDWIVHVDSDDWLSEFLVETISREFEKGFDIIAFGYFSVGSNDKITKHTCSPTLKNVDYKELKKEALSSILFDSKKFGGMALNTTWGKAFKREFILNNSLLFNEGLLRIQDVVNNLYCFFNAEKVLFIPAALYYYRMDNESLSRGYKKETFERVTLSARAVQEFAQIYRNHFVDFHRSVDSFCRRCFRIVLKQDYLNKENKKSFFRRRKDFIQGLSQNPYKRAYSDPILNNENLRLRIEDTLIAKRLFLILSCYHNVIICFLKFRNRY